MTKVALVYAYCIKNNYSRSWQLGLAYIYSYLKKFGYTVEYFHSRDYNYDLNQLIAAVKNFAPEFIGLYTNYTLRKYIKEFCLAVKNPSNIIVIGGPDATVRPELYADFSDFVVIGEGEETFRELIEKKTAVNGLCFKENDKLIYTQPRELITDINSLPFPYRSYFSMDLLTMRGACPYKCSFCHPVVNKLFGNKIRFRSPEKICEEIDMVLKKEKGGIYFADDHFTINKKHALAVCNTILVNNLKFDWVCNSRSEFLDEDMVCALVESGCKTIVLGIESGSEKMMNEIYNKKINIDMLFEKIKLLKKHRLAFSANFMMGGPGETIDDIKKSYNLIYKIKPDCIAVTFFTPTPGSILYDKYKDVIDNDKLEECGCYGTENTDFCVQFFGENISFNKLLTYKSNFFLIMIKLFFKKKAGIFVKLLNVLLIFIYYIIYFPNFFKKINFIRINEDFLFFTMYEPINEHNQIRELMIKFYNSYLARVTD